MCHRFSTVVELIPDLNDWCVWAAGPALHQTSSHSCGSGPSYFSTFVRRLI
jgi:hypothetical protein